MTENGPSEDDSAAAIASGEPSRNAALNEATSDSTWVNAEDWASASMDALIGTKLGDRYDVLSVIASGGMGIIYRGRHILLDKIVAIKVLNPVYLNEPGALERFQYEAKVASRLSHPNIVTTHDFGVTNENMFYLVMDYVDGQTLAQILEEKTFLPADRALDIMSQVCEGLEHAHQEGLIHRDLKPSNIMITANAAGRDTVKILDFGLAKNQDEGKRQGLSQAGLIIGTVFYISPEQWGGTQADVRSEVYAVGCVLYEALAGCLPFVGDTFLETCQKHLQELPPPIAEVQPGAWIPPQLEALVQRALEKNPDDRFQSAADLRVAIDQLSHELRSGLHGVNPGNAGNAGNRTTVSNAGNASGRSNTGNLSKAGQASDASDASNLSNLSNLSSAKGVNLPSDEEALPEPALGGRYVMVQIVLPVLGLVLVGACAALYFVNSGTIREALFAKLDEATAGDNASVGGGQVGKKTWWQLYRAGEVAFDNERYALSEKILERALVSARSANRNGQVLLTLRKLEEVFYVQQKFKEADDLNDEIHRLATFLAAREAAIAAGTTQDVAATTKSPRMALMLKSAVNEANEPQDDRIAHLAIMCHKHGQCDTAISLLQHAVAISKKVNGAQSMKTADRITELASLYMALDQPSKAQPLFDTVMQIKAANGKK